MRFSIDALPPDVRSAFENDLFAIADTKFVLGNWYALCIMNGRSLPDFAALTAMTGAAYGHTRSLWQYLVNFGHKYPEIERGRGPDAIRSMNLLDESPKGWPDFLAATWLAEQAMWMAVSGFLKSPDRVLAGLAEKIGEEIYFHLKYSQGWMEILAESKKDTRAFAAALESRKGSAWIDAKPDLSPKSVAADGWIPAHRRCGALPGGLFEAIRFKDPEAAH